MPMRQAITALFLAFILLALPVTENAQQPSQQQPQPPPPDQAPQQSPTSIKVPSSVSTPSTDGARRSSNKRSAHTISANSRRGFESQLRKQNNMIDSREPHCAFAERDFS